MRITIRPAAAPNTEIDVSRALIAAVAHELHRHTGGNDILNWLEAERFIASLASPQAEAAPKLPAATAAPGRGRGESPRPSRRKPAATSNPERYTGPIPILTAR